MLPTDQTIAARPVIGFDCETHLSKRGLAAPPLVCATLSARGLGREWLAALVEHLDPAGYLERPGGFILDAAAARAVWPDLVAGDVHLVGHRITYDLGVMANEAGCLAEVFALLDEGAISDTLIRERLSALSRGTFDWDSRALVRDGHYSLASIVKKRFDVDLTADKMKTPKGCADVEAWVEEAQACSCGLPPWYGIGWPQVVCVDGLCGGYGLKGPWRLRYRQLARVPLHDWPDEAVDYAIEDAEWAELACADQGTDQPFDDAPGPLIYADGSFVDEQNQTAASWALALMAAWGPRCGEAAATKTLDEWSTKADACLAVGRAAGFVRASGSENRAIMLPRIAAAYTARGRDVPRNDPTDKNVEKSAAMIAEVDAGATSGKTAAWKRATKTPDPAATYRAEAVELAKGNQKYDRDTLAASGDPELETYARGTLYKSYMSKYADILRIGITTPITSFPNPMVTSGRTGWANPPLQQPPGKGGYREAHEPREGTLYGAGDYDTIELCSQAQNCIDLGIGDTMASKINAGIDLHVDLACEELGIDYTEGVRLRAEGSSRMTAARNRAKAGNFGFWGGMGPPACVAAYGVETFSPTGDLDEAIREATKLKDAWKRKNPEQRDYFAMISELLNDGGGSYTAMQFMSGRLRVVDRFAQAANTYFQGRTADGAKLGIFNLARECYTDRESVLWGTRPWLLLHDEVLAEVPVVTAQAAVERMCVVLREAMEVLIPDVRVNIDPLLCRRWSKGADPVRTADGVLVPWEPWTRGDRTSTWSPWAGPREGWLCEEYAPGRIDVYSTGEVRRTTIEHGDPVVARHRAEAFVLEEEAMA